MMVSDLFPVIGFWRYPDEYKRVLMEAGDIWRADSKGAYHRQSPDYFGSLFSLRVPDGVPLMYKNRKASGMVVHIDSENVVTAFEIRYGNPYTDGYCLAFRNPDSCSFDDVTSFYRR